MVALYDSGLLLFHDAERELIRSKGYDLSVFYLYPNTFCRVKAQYTPNQGPVLTEANLLMLKSLTQTVIERTDPVGILTICAAYMDEFLTLVGALDSKSNERCVFLRAFEERGCDLVLGEYADSHSDPRWTHTLEELFGFQFYNQARPRAKRAAAG